MITKYTKIKLANQEIRGDVNDICYSSLRLHSFKLSNFSKDNSQCVTLYKIIVIQIFCIFQEISSCDIKFPSHLFLQILIQFSGQISLLWRYKRIQITSFSINLKSCEQSSPSATIHSQSYVPSYWPFVAESFLGCCYQSCALNHYIILLSGVSSLSISCLFYSFCFV